MKYKFPIIECLDDVLPAIEGRNEFIIAERVGYTVVNYVVANTHTFDMTGPDDVLGAIRRECRGIKFFPNGKIAARPFHKFFNIGEREETLPNNVDLSVSHVIMEKLDGSMIHPINIDGQLRLATKMGLTDVAAQAYEILTVAQGICLESNVRGGITPLFEFVSPENKIVLTYDQAELVYLGSRVNRTGEYVTDPYTARKFPVVKMYGSVKIPVIDYIDSIRGQEGREGDIIRFADGHMMKIKSNWYVRIHKAMDYVRVDRNIIALALNEELDDVLPMLQIEERTRASKIVEDFWIEFENKLNHLYKLVDIAKHDFNMDRKRIALEFIPTLACKDDGKFLFHAANGRDLREALLNQAKAAVGNTTNYEKLLTLFRKI